MGRSLNWKRIENPGTGIFGAFLEFDCRYMLWKLLRNAAQHRTEFVSGYVLPSFSRDEHWGRKM